jgi:hypothetical protein
MYQYSDAPWKTSLTEVEVFIGNIMGQNHKQTAYQKESSRAMRDGKSIPLLIRDFKSDLSIL